MLENLKNRFPHAGKLTLALVEHLTKPVIGKNAQDVLKAPAIQKELENTLAEILLDVEVRFIRENPDNRIAQTLIDLPLADIERVQTAVYAFYERPSDPQLHNVMVDSLKKSLGGVVGEGEIETAVDRYLHILQQAVSDKFPEVAAKFNAHNLQNIADNTSDSARISTEILQELKQIRIELKQPRLQRQSLESTITQLKENQSQPQVTIEIIMDYSTLHICLTRLADGEYRHLIRSLLTPRDQSFLPAPVGIVGRGDFLGYMQQRKKLDKVTKYLVNNHPDRCIG